jgi:CRISPR-associated exonuclease Cas4
MLLIAAAVFLFLALVLLLTREQRDSSAMPEGEILYEDISENRYTSKVLTSDRYGLRGKPDYLIMTKDGVVPVELKSTLRPPLRGGVHKSHMAQILAYCAMVGESLGERIPYGLVIYRDQVPRRVVPTPERMAWMEQMTEAVRAGRQEGPMHRDHGHVERCLNCGVREACTEALHEGQGWQRRRAGKSTGRQRRRAS